MQNINFKHKCSKWIIEPDDIIMRPNGGFKDKHHTCECELWACGWLKTRISRIRNRIIDKLNKEAWETIIRFGKAFDINLE
jgi:hypothetical protein